MILHIDPKFFNILSFNKFLLNMFFFLTNSQLRYTVYLHFVKLAWFYAIYSLIGLFTNYN